MPIIVKDYTWRDCDRNVSIRVPLHGAPKASVDLLTSELYLKASYEQFFFEIFPTSAINVAESKCTINEREILYELYKQAPGRWSELERPLSKQEKMAIKTEAIASVSDRLQGELKRAQEMRHTLKKSAVSEAIGIDTRQRNLIESIREEEKANALGDVETWKENVQQEQQSKQQPKKVRPKIKRQYFAQNVAEHTSIPLPRRTQVIDVEFTPRVLPTPSRESQEAEETEWLRKQAAARRSAGFVSEDLRPEEKNPQFLLAKAENFLKSQNYLGAISALSFGIDISPKFVDFYIMRSMAHYEVGNFNKCIKDTSKALEMMKPEVSANLSERVTCIARRGMALHKLGYKRPALDELKAALTLQPEAYILKHYHMVLDELNAEAAAAANGLNNNEDEDEDEVEENEKAAAVAEKKAEDDDDVDRDNETPSQLISN